MASSANGALLYQPSARAESPAYSVSTGRIHEQSHVKLTHTHSPFDCLARAGGSIVLGHEVTSYAKDLLYVSVICLRDAAPGKRSLCGDVDPQLRQDEIYNRCCAAGRDDRY